MTLVVTHNYVTNIAEDPGSGGAGGIVGPIEWNANHTLTGIVSVAQGGTNASSASGTSLDNITGFASTGYIKRTGAGTYSFASPIAVADGGTNSASASGTALDNITGFASTGYIKRTGAGTYTFNSPIPVADGGLGIGSGTSGGVLYFSGSTTLASSAALAANALVIGGGAGAAPFTASGTTWDNTNLALTIAGATVTTSNPILNLSQTWNAGAVVFTALKLNVTATANASNSPIIDLQSTGTSFFSIAFSANGGSPTMYFGGTPSQFGIASSGLIAATDFSAYDGSFNRNIDVLGANNGQLRISSTGQVVWFNQTPIGGALDTGISRSAAGVIAHGNGTQGDASATFLAKTKAGAPTTSDVPSGCWILIRDTTNNTTKVYYNNAGTLQTVALV